MRAMKWVRTILSHRNMLCTGAVLLCASGAAAQMPPDFGISTSDLNSFLARTRSAALTQDKPALCGLLVYPFPLKIDEKGQYLSAKDCEAHFATTFPRALLQKLQHIRSQDFSEVNGMLVAGNGWAWVTKVWVGTAPTGGVDEGGVGADSQAGQMKIIDLNDPGGIMGPP
jgi:hypothetical protein